MTPALLMMLAAGASAGSASDGSGLFDFRDPGELRRWVAVHDTVMGGRSDGGLASTDDGHAVFAGHLSLENNGGFASVRTVPRQLGLDHATGLVLRVRGDGRTYQLRLRQDDRFDGIAWRFRFDTTPGQWSVVTVPFSACEPVWRGRRVAGAGPVEPAQIRQVGFMLADKQAGDYRLEIARVGAY
jgi:monofunctional biosynthetic peptidoglycan transglycosylase